MSLDLMHNNLVVKNTFLEFDIKDSDCPGEKTKRRASVGAVFFGTSEAIESSDAETGSTLGSDEVAYLTDDDLGPTHDSQGEQQQFYHSECDDWFCPVQVQLEPVFPCDQPQPPVFHEQSACMKEMSSFEPLQSSSKVAWSPLSLLATAPTPEFAPEYTPSKTSIDSCAKQIALSPDAPEYKPSRTIIDSNASQTPLRPTAPAYTPSNTTLVSGSSQTSVSQTQSPKWNHSPFDSSPSRSPMRKQAPFDLSPSRSPMRKQVQFDSSPPQSPKRRQNNDQNRWKNDKADANYTTIMLRNVPNDYTRDMLIELLKARGLGGCYDFLYLPFDFKRGAGLGYAFINMICHEDAMRAMEVLTGFCSWKLRSSKVLQVTWSTPLQGLWANIERYRNSPVMHPDVPEQFKPLLMTDGEPVEFPPPTRPLPSPSAAYN